MLSNEDLKQLSDLLDEKLDQKFEANNAVLRAEMALNNSKINNRLDRIDERLDCIDERLDCIDERLDHLESDVAKLKDDVKSINLTIENELRPNINLLCEVCVPEIRRFSNAADDIDSMKADMHVLKLTVTKHSERLNQIAST